MVKQKPNDTDSERETVKPCNFTEDGWCRTLQKLFYMGKRASSGWAEVWLLGCKTTCFPIILDDFKV